ncbi:hypothetical protein Y032_0157g3198 [Ancylostoma ceylanicum]|uniref:Uncharacterized protein n=1 Tax=Ancylostoma ceylanicum TaxID=53326 RepID=A0A016SYW7_9BILA|nr:hypothetical protein Y032_0157g3198 [Ancylostoma ceylanicum]
MADEQAGHVASTTNTTCKPSSTAAECNAGCQPEEYRITQACCFKMDSQLNTSSLCRGSNSPYTLGTTCNFVSDSFMMTS